jgi:AraC-like DNA-binding protein
VSVSTVATLVVGALVVAFTRKSESKAFLFFSLFILEVAFSTAFTVFLSFDPYENVARFGNMTIFLLGPTLYLYVVTFFEPRARFRFIHALPFAAFTAFLAYFFFTSLSYPLYPIRFDWSVYRVVEFGDNCLFLGLVVRCLADRGVGLKTLLRRSQERLVWIRFLFLSAVVLCVIRFLVFLTLAAPAIRRGYAPLLVTYCVLALVFFVLFLYLIITKTHLIQESKKYADSPIDEKEKRRLANKIDAYMEMNKPYLESDLSLSRIAKRLGLPPKKLSQVLSEVYGTNFYHFINRYRIRDSIALLESSEARDSTILDILLSVGFNSKSTFNAAFKEIAGVSPREYRQQQKRTNASVRSTSSK